MQVLSLPVQIFLTSSLSSLKCSGGVCGKEVDQPYLCVGDCSLILTTFRYSL